MWHVGERGEFGYLANKFVYSNFIGIPIYLLEGQLSFHVIYLVQNQHPIFLRDYKARLTAEKHLIDVLAS